MDLRNRLCLLLVPAAALVVACAASAGCANNHSGAPFHMYDSPLLQGQAASKHPRSRSYDPLELHENRATAEADITRNDRETSAVDAPRASDATSKPARRRNATRTQRKKQPPALASKRREASDEGSQRDKSQASSSQVAKEDQAPKRRQEPAQDDRDAPSDEDGALAAEYVWSIYRVNGVEFSRKARRSVPTLFRECKEAGKIYHSSEPDIGDIVFFHNTDDVNDDGRNNDWYTFTALVEGHGDDGQVSLLGYRDGEVQRFDMNLEKPDVGKTRHGETANTTLRPRRSDDPPFTQYLAGQLFAGTCSVLGDKAQMMVIDNWQPGMKLD